MTARKLLPREVARAYKQVEIAGFAKTDLLVTIYSTIVTQFRRAALAIENNNIAARGEAVSNALELIGELRQSLDFHKAPELAMNLEQFYLTATQTVLKAHRQAARDSFMELAHEFSAVSKAFEESLSS